MVRPRSWDDVTPGTLLAYRDAVAMGASRLCVYLGPSNLYGGLRVAYEPTPNEMAVSMLSLCVDSYDVLWSYDGDGSVPDAD